MENVGGIARWISGHYPDVKYELLNYNPLASAKYEMTGQEYSLPAHPMFTADEMNEFKTSGHYPDVKYELLNYNPLASAKYEMTGQEYSLPAHPMFTADEMNEFKTAARENGVTDLIEE